MMNLRVKPLKWAASTHGIIYGSGLGYACRIQDSGDAELGPFVLHETSDYHGRGLSFPTLLEAKAEAHNRYAAAVLLELEVAATTEPDLSDAIKSLAIKVDSCRFITNEMKETANLILSGTTA